jgi:hypothetical protein
MRTGSTDGIDSAAEFLDLPGEADRLRCNPMLTSTRARVRGLAAVLAVLLLVFCLSAVGPAVEDKGACSGLDPSERICAQSGTVGPTPVVAHQLVAIHTVALPATPLPRDKVSPEPVQHRADPSTPRAPPRLA